MKTIYGNVRLVSQVETCIIPIRYDITHYYKINIVNISITIIYIYKKNTKGKHTYIYIKYNTL